MNIFAFWWFWCGIWSARWIPTLTLWIIDFSVSTSSTFSSLSLIQSLKRLTTVKRFEIMAMHFGYICSICLNNCRNWLWLFFFSRDNNRITTPTTLTKTTRQHLIRAKDPNQTAHYKICVDCDYLNHHPVSLIYSLFLSQKPSSYTRIAYKREPHKIHEERASERWKERKREILKIDINARCSILCVQRSANC